LQLRSVFPVITLLISLSLIGTICVQYSWLHITLINRQGVIKDKLIRGMNEVGIALMQQKGASPSLKNDRRSPGFGGSSDNMKARLVAPPAIANKFTEQQVAGQLRKAFQQQGLEDLQFEFAITSTINLQTSRLRSRDFATQVKDTADNKNLLLEYLFQPLTGSDLDNLTPEETMTVVVPNFKEIVLGEMRWTIMGSIVFTLILIAAYGIYLIVNVPRQKQLNEIRSDFINNMTHEFESPLATISVAVDALRNEKVAKDREKMNYFSNIIKEENARMHQHVTNLLQTATTDKQPPPPVRRKSFWSWFTLRKHSNISKQ